MAEVRNSAAIYISHHTATRINTFAFVRQVVMNIDQRWQSLRSLYKLPKSMTDGSSE